MGHLQWNMILGDGNSLIDKMYTFLWLFFFLSPFLIQRTFFSFLFGLSTFFVISYFYLKDKTVGSMWCWIVNSIMIYYAFYLLMYLPFLSNMANSRSPFNAPPAEISTSFNAIRSSDLIGKIRILLSFDMIALIL
jgi:hypothetical protein